MKARSMKTAIVLGLVACKKSGLLGREVRFRTAPSFEVEFDSFAQVGSRALHVLALRRHAQFKAARDVPIVLFGNESRESIGHVSDAN